VPVLSKELAEDPVFLRLLKNRETAVPRINDETGITDIGEWAARLRQTSEHFGPEVRQNIEGRIYLVEKYAVSPSHLQLLLEEFVVKSK
jgi:hypothetical protein